MLTEGQAVQLTYPATAEPRTASLLSGGERT